MNLYQTAWAPTERFLLDSISVKNILEIPNAICCISSYYPGQFKQSGFNTTFKCNGSSRALKIIFT